MAGIAPQIKSIADHDLNKLPVAMPLEDKVNQLTYGDLHGNALLLINLLITSGYAKCADEKAYDEIVKLYDRSEKLTKPDLENFQKFLDDKLVFPEENKHILIRLLGDMFYDRGKNDALTLLVLKKIKRKQIILSNHDIGFWIKLIKNKDTCSPNVSYGGLNTAIEDKIITKIEIMEIFREHIFPNLVLIGYDFKEPNTLDLFQHAPGDFNSLRKLAKYYHVPFDPEIKSDPKKICAAIDQINTAFQISVQNNTFLDEYLMQKNQFTADFEELKTEIDKLQLEEFEKDKETYIKKLEQLYWNYPLYALIWRRPEAEMFISDNYGDLIPIVLPSFSSAETRHPNVAGCTIHGHDKHELPNSHTFDKDIGSGDICQGELVFATSTGATKHEPAVIVKAEAEVDSDADTEDEAKAEYADNEEEEEIEQEAEDEDDNIWEGLDYDEAADFDEKINENPATIHSDFLHDLEYGDRFTMFDRPKRKIKPLDEPEDVSQSTKKQKK